MAKNVIERAKELLSQMRSGVGNAVQNFNQPTQVVSPNFRPLFQTPLANIKPINWGQVGQNVGARIQQQIPQPVQNFLRPIGQSAIDIGQATKETAQAWGRVPLQISQYIQKKPITPNPDMSFSAQRGIEQVPYFIGSSILNPAMGAVEGNIGFLTRQLLGKGKKSASEIAKATQEATKIIENSYQKSPMSSQVGGIKIGGKPTIPKGGANIKAIYDNLNQADLKTYGKNTPEVGKIMFGGESGTGIGLAKNAPQELNQVGILAQSSKSQMVRRDARKVVYLLSDRVPNEAKIPELQKLAQNLESKGTPEGTVIENAINKLVSPLAPKGGAKDIGKGIDLLKQYPLEGKGNTPYKGIALHGTNEKEQIVKGGFKSGEGTFGKGIYLDPLGDRASGYYGSNSKNIIATEYNFKKPYIVKGVGETPPSPEILKKQGYDGIVFLNRTGVGRGIDEIVAFDNKSIKVREDLISQSKTIPQGELNIPKKELQQHSQSLVKENNLPYNPIIPQSRVALPPTPKGGVGVQPTVGVSGTYKGIDNLGVEQLGQKPIATVGKTTIPTKPLVEPKIKQPVLGGGPKVPSSGDIITDPEQKIIKALKEAKPIRGTQEKLYTAERGRRAIKVAKAGQTIPGEKGYFAQLKQLKGELPKAQFEGVRNKLTSKDIDFVFNKVEQMPYFSPFEKVAAKNGLAKLLGEKGTTVPTKSELSLLSEVFSPEFIQAAMGNRSLMQKIWSGIGQVAGVSRSLLAGGFDMTFGLRQGIFSGYRYPKQWFSAFKAQFKEFGSEKVFQKSMETIKADPMYKLAREAKVSITDLGSGTFRPREEQFQSALAEKIPIIGRFVRASGRAYTGFANKYRFDIFKDFFFRFVIQFLVVHRFSLA